MVQTQFANMLPLYDHELSDVTLVEGYDTPSGQREGHL